MSKRVRSVNSQDTRNRSEEAFRRIQITKEQLDGTLKISSRLREAGLTTERVVEILDADASEDSRKFVDRYASISVSDRAYLPIEAVCLAAGLTTRRLWELISGARLEQSQDITKLIIADSMPRVALAAVKAATESLPILNGQGEVAGWTNGDPKAMEFLGKVSGLLPQAKPGIQIFNNNGNLPIPQEEPDETPLPGMDATLKEIHHSITAPQLEAPKEQIPFVPLIEAEFEDIDVRN